MDEKLEARNYIIKLKLFYRDNKPLLFIFQYSLQLLKFFFKKNSSTITYIQLND